YRKNTVPGRRLFRARAAAMEKSLAIIDTNHVKGTGKWRQPGVPHRGWECTGIEDLGACAITCEMCEVQLIRYVHEMRHPDYPDALNVGCICAGHMEEDLVGAREREEDFKKEHRGGNDGSIAVGERPAKGTHFSTLKTASTWSCSRMTMMRLGA